MRGSIEVESMEGEGTAFSFVLDLPAAEAVTTPERDMPASPARSVRPAHILLAEDVVLNQELAVAMLTNWGHTVEVVSDGAAAVAAVMRTRYDLVLMDVQMPVMDGIEAMRRIRGLGGAFTTLPIIAMTANVMTRDIELCMKAGADGHVGKPFAPEKLRAVIEHWTDADTKHPQAEGSVLVQTPGHDSAPLDDLRDMVGPDATISIVGKFVADLDRRLLGEPNGMSGWHDIGNDAHALVSTAGLLGFGRLSEACRTLEQTCALAPFDEKAAQAHLSLVRNEVAWAKAEAMRLQGTAAQAA
jgi:CheY-like chemotaxis protein/HPt (histidine-containing phosphotransfer) domain-containing protein